MDILLIFDIAKKWPLYRNQLFVNSYIKIECKSKSVNACNLSILKMFKCGIPIKLP